MFLRNRMNWVGMLGGLCTLLIAGPANAVIINVPADHATIQAAVNASGPGDTIMVAAGTYNEDVTVTGKTGLSIIGAGASTTTIVGPHNAGLTRTFEVQSSPNTTVAGFTITRSGNNTTDWGGNIKVNGLLISSSDNSVARDNIITGNRNGLYMENNNGVTVRNNVIDNNRTGLHMVAINTNCTVTQNAITNNWTDGVLFRTESVSNNTTGSVFSNNNISGNWYGQIEYREDFVPMGKNFSGNWLGTTTPVISAVSGGEPGYAAQIPVIFGGGATPPGGQPDVKGNASAQFDITPMLESGTDTNVETTPGWGTNGFQGSFTSVTVTPTLAQTGATGRVQEGVNSVTASTVNVLPGTYDEDVLITLANTQLLGAGAGVTTIRGVQGGDNATIRVSANNVTVAGLTITRLGNNTTDWNDPNLNSAGVAIIGTTLTGMTVRDCIITGNRTGIDVNNSSGHTIRNNEIIFNRTGMIFRNQTDNLTIVENKIFDNWTVGVLFLDASGGTNSPVQTALNCNISNNDISGNWYGQIEDRAVGGSLPVPGTTNLKNFSGNWLGTTTPVISAVSGGEPGYAAQIPVAFGGAATPPGGQPDVKGAAVANFDITPMLNAGTDTNVETVLLRGTNGFQGDYSAVRVTSDLAQVETGGRIQEGITRVTNSTVHVNAGLYTEVVNLNKVGVKVIGAGVGSTIINYQGFTQPGGFNGGVYSQTNDVELRNLTVTRTVAGAVAPSVPRYGIKFDFASDMIIDNVQVTNSFRSGLDLHGVIDITVNNVSSTGNGGAGIFCTDVKGADLSNITTTGNPWVGVSIATSGQHTAYGTNDIVFSGTNSFGESAGNNGGLQLEAFEFAPVPPAGVNPITWSSNPADAAMVTIQSADFGYALSGGLFGPVNTTYVRFYNSLAQAQAAAAGNPDHIVAGSRFIQEADDSNGLPNSGPTDLYVYDFAGDTMSIQAAINAASTSATDTVHIGSGSYVTGADASARDIILSAGTSPGQVTITGNMTLNAGDTLPIEINGTNPATQFDNFIVNGGVTLGGAALTVTPGFSPANNTQFTIIANDSNDPVGGTFAGKPEGNVFNDGGQLWKITYVGGDGNDVVLTAVEAGTMQLTYDKACYKPGDTLTATLRMKDLSGPAAGFQAFLAYNTARLTFVSWAYTSAPFGLPVLNSPTLVNPSPGLLNLAAGINQLGGQTPSSADADLVNLTFTVLGPDVCSIGGLLTFRANNPPTRLTDINGQPLAALTTVNAPAITIDGTAPTITSCPGPVTIQCHESTEPGIPLGVMTGGVMIYYNLTGPEAPANQAFLKAQFSYANTNGGAFTFSSAPLTGFGPLTWHGIFGQVAPPSQFGFDFVLPAPTNDSSVPVPVLLAYNNTNNSAAGRAADGARIWTIGDYKDGAPNGPGNASNVDINSLFRSPTPGVPGVDLVPSFTVTQAGTLFTAQVSGKLVSDGLIHWYNPATPDTPMAAFGMDGEFFFTGTLTYDSTGDDGTDRKDFYQGTITFSANSPNTALGFALGTDNCTTFPTVTYTDVNNLGGCNGTGTIDRAWKVTDCAGNFTTCLQVITVVDTTPPVITCPAGQTIDCAENIPAPYANTADFLTAGGTASDNCSPVASLVLTSLGDGPLTGGPCGGTITRSYQIADACGNNAVCTQVFTVNDTVAPVATSTGAIAFCYPDVASAEAAAKANSNATDNCVAALTETAVTVGDCSAQISVTFTDACNNASNVLIYNTRIDNTPPVITCPANISVTPPAGTCNAAAVVITPATATDNCTAPGSIVIAGVRSDALPLTDPYPQGVTSITWTATDECGNASQCVQTVTVNGITITVSVELSPTIDNNNLDAFPLQGTLSRCITFEVWSCSPNVMTSHSQVLNFTHDGVNNRAIALNQTICVPSVVPSIVTCVTARDELHTLRSRVQIGDGLVQNTATTFTADFTGTTADELARAFPPPVTPGSGHRLIGGNVNDDIFIDILDFGTWAGQFDFNAPNAEYPDGNTTCSTASPHSDISGDGEIDASDFSFIAINFLMVAQDNCCSNDPITAPGDDDMPVPHENPQPVTSISVKKLFNMGLGHLAAGDVNGDGMLDQADVQAVFNGQMPAPTPVQPPINPVDPGSISERRLP